MKLIIQIPCYNEAKSLPATIKDLPKQLAGIDTIELQVIDDGSTDQTAQLAQQLGVHHIVSFKQNRGLAAAFKAGVDNALSHRADILVNTDADNQYRGEDISELIRPILRGEADLVIGSRPIDDHPEFSWLKKKLQRLGSWVLRRFSGTNVQDVSSGFRAFSRAALLHMNIFSDFSYCLETLIQAGYQNLKIVSVPIRINPQTRKSRLFRSLGHYLWQSARTIINIFLIYNSSRFFSVLAGLSFLAALVLAGRYVFLVLFENAPASNFWPSIILAGSLLILAFQLYLTGVVSYLISSNRKIGEEIVYRLRRMEMESKPPQDQP